MACRSEVNIEMKTIGLNRGAALTGSPGLSFPPQECNVLILTVLKVLWYQTEAFPLRQKNDLEQCYRYQFLSSLLFGCLEQDRGWGGVGDRRGSRECQDPSNGEKWRLVKRGWLPQGGQCPAPKTAFSHLYDLHLALPPSRCVVPPHG